MVAAVPRPEVDLEQVAAEDLAVGGAVVRDRAVRAGRHDRLERDAVGAQLDHAGLQPPGHLALGLPRRRPAERLAQRPVADRAGLPEQRQLAVVLDRAQLLDRVPERHQLRSAVQAAQLGVRLDADVVGLERQPPDAVATGSADQGRRALAVVQQLEPGRLLPRLGQVAAVRAQDGAAVAPPAARRSSR